MSPLIPAGKGHAFPTETLRIATADTLTDVTVSDVNRKDKIPDMYFEWFGHCFSNNIANSKIFSRIMTSTNSGAHKIL